MTDEKKVIGIIGGMGPMATADLFTKLVSFTDAKRDSEHAHIIIDNFPQIPDRTTAILNGGESPLPYLIESAEKLRKAGADFLIIPCITSHYFVPKLSECTGIKILSIIEETAKYLKSENISKVVLLATNGTRNSKVFNSIFENYGIEIMLPSEDVQEELMSIIYRGVKAGVTAWDTTVLNTEIKRLESLGAEAVVLGCTELPLAAEMYGIDGVHINPTDILARAAIKYAGYNVK